MRLGHTEKCLQNQVFDLNGVSFFFPSSDTTILENIFWPFFFHSTEIAWAISKNVTSLSWRKLGSTLKQFQSGMSQMLGAEGAPSEPI